MQKLAHLFSFIVAVLLLLAIAASAQTRGGADPSGFLNLTIGGTGGGTTNRVTYLGLGLTRPVEYQRTASSVGSNTISDSGANWTANQFSGSNGAYFVEITSVNGSTTATGVGTTYSIASNTSSTLSLTSTLASGVNAPVGYKIRKQWTLASLFGATNGAGLQGGDSSSADQVLLWNGGSLEAYYYQTSGGVGWRKVGDTATDASSTVIPFYAAVLVQRQQTGALSFILNGTLKSGQTSIPIASGDNYLGNVYPANVPLTRSGLYTGSLTNGLAGGDSATADQIRIWNGAGFDAYYFQTSGSGGTGWRKVGDTSTDAGSAVIPQGAGFVLRRNNAAAFTWLLPETLVTTAAPASDRKLLNISTRGLVQTGDRVLIGGFIVTGNVAKKVIVRALGPSLATAGISSFLNDPMVELHDASGTTIATNDNWQDTSGAAEISSVGLAPGDTREPALLQTLTPAAYTVIVRGVNNSSGIGLVEIYDLAASADSKLANISTRGFVDTGDNVMIGGVIVGGSGTSRVVVRALGPSLASAGVTSAIADPTLTLVDGNGASVAANDNWQDDASATALQLSQLAPSNPKESATLQSLAAGNYTAIIRGANESTGVALIEVYTLD